MKDGADAFARVEQLCAELERIDHERAREAARGVTAAVLDLHRTALARWMEIASGQGAAGRALIDDFARDELGRSVLLLHGLHPEPVHVRARAALDGLRAYLGAHGVVAALVEVPDEVRSRGFEAGATVRVRLDSSGRAAPIDRLAREVEDALLAAAPDAERVEVEVPASPGDTRGFVPLERVRASAAAKRDLCAEAPEGRCELCARPLERAHEHLLEPQRRTLACACTACALLFDGAGGPNGRRRVTRRVRQLPALSLDDARWAELGVPVGLAFLFWSSAADGPVAVYPGPAGATEAAVDRGAWDRLVADAAELATLEPDVEALLVRRPRVGQGRGDRADAGGQLMVSIDLCYELTGLLRTHWRGFGGGDEAWRSLDAFFADLIPPPRSAEPEVAR